LGGLARPQVPPGAQRALVDALHALHHEAGWPSLRWLAREAGFSHTTVSTVFSSPRLPSWGVLELLVEAMDGDVGEFHDLWLTASSVDPAPPLAPRVAGRRAELAAVRRHLGSGRGLLLVTGEAGIGKTRLVDTAMGSAGDTFVARGACLPLSAQVPLLPVTDVLRSVYEVDQGQWVKMGIAGCAPYVLSSLRQLLPELDEPGDVPAAPAGDDWWRQRLFSAVGTTWSALASVRPLAVLVEDLHWGDSTTLDLLEYLLSRLPGIPLVGTYRHSDPSTPTATCEWMDRTRRRSAVTTLELGPLTRDESAEMLALLGRVASPNEVDRIHQRSGGLPLFTEQLAAQSAEEEALPRLLADLLDGRFAGISHAEWAIARALGVADRPLTDAQLRSLTGLAPAALTAGLHALDEQFLITTGIHEVRLRHPLFAEAVRRRLVAGEAADEHRRLALTLAESPRPSAAEVAEHWQRADDPEQEILWRIRAAQEAGARFALAHEAEQWRRALELWPDDTDYAGSPGVRKVDAYLAAIDALEGVDWQAADRLADEAMRSVGDPRGPSAAEVYRRAGKIQANLGNPDAGLELVDRALHILDADQQPADRARALLTRGLLLGGLDRIDEAAAACATAADLVARLGDPVMYRLALAAQAGHELTAGRVEQALERVRAAARVETEGPDPRGDLSVAVTHTHILMTTCHSADEVAAAGRPGLEAAHEWGIENHSASALLGNLSEALRHAGRVQEAAQLIDPVTEEPPLPHQWPTYSERGQLDLLRGRCEAATRLLEELSDIFVVDLANRVLCAQDAPTVDLWCGRPWSAYGRLTGLLREVVAVEDPEVDIAGLLVLDARAAADGAALASADPEARTRLLRELEWLLARTSRDPFAASDVYAVRAALRVGWAAELARLAGAPSLEHWAAATAEWEKIDRPHDSAYCRWRGAQAALAAGQASTATKLLRRAERDAREHVPQLEAIRATVGSGLRPQA